MEAMLGRLGRCRHPGAPLWLPADDGSEALVYLVGYPILAWFLAAWHASEGFFQLCDESAAVAV